MFEIAPEMSNFNMKLSLSLHFGKIALRESEVAKFGNTVKFSGITDENPYFGRVSLLILYQMIKTTRRESFHFFVVI